MKNKSMIILLSIFITSYALAEKIIPLTTINKAMNPVDIAAYFEFVPFTGKNKVVLKVYKKYNNPGAIVPADNLDLITEINNKNFVFDKKIGQLTYHDADLGDVVCANVNSLPVLESKSKFLNKNLTHKVIIPTGNCLINAIIQKAESVIVTTGDEKDGNIMQHSNVAATFYFVNLNLVLKND